ncbi:MAG: LamG-like jellyroll fold domain-containing protein [Verrucomicrobiota bacterium]
MKLEDCSPEEQEWIHDYLNGSISPEQFAAFQERLLAEPGLRQVLRRILALDETLYQEGAELDPASSTWIQAETRATSAHPAFETLRELRWLPLAAAATIIFLLIAFLRPSSAPSDPDAPILTRGEGEPQAQGFAVVERLLDPAWPTSSATRRRGELLGPESFHLTAGSAEIQFFSGATMTVTGPARIQLHSAWEATCHEGSLRMDVPPAARGFTLHGPSSKIVDLGTEFGMQVDKNGAAQVEVFEGEILVRHRSEEEKQVLEKEAWILPKAGPSRPTPPGSLQVPTTGFLRETSQHLRLTGFQQWLAYQTNLARDPRLIAYFTHRNGTLTGSSGTVILAESVDGRWPGQRTAYEFRRPGSRIRTHLEGTFPAFTFVTWVRIDSLDRWYNALFMGDGYETGEPHWQIRNDGKLMLSVMVDDTRPNPRSAKDAGFHRVYFSPPFWDMSMSGEWLHLSSVYDPDQRVVAHYVNGEQIHEEVIQDRYFIKDLRIGAGELGNWGQPFREEPTFAIRNLNGRMEELAIFKEALSAKEVRQLYERGREP